MKLVVCAVYDTKAKAHLTPFFVHNTAVAVRAFAGAVNADKGTSPVADNPGDFILFHLGTFDDETGQIVMLGYPDNLGNGAQYRRELYTPPELRAETQLTNQQDNEGRN